jgi:SDR family mycofactocin-dependent oxidoreductase
VLEGKVALVTGGARGVGRSLSVRLAQLGANVIVIDICAQVGTIEYPLGTSADLEETARLVSETGRKAAVYEADVRDLAALDKAVQQGLGEFGRLDIVCANAGICRYTSNLWEMTEEQWHTDIDTNLTGAWHTVKATVPTMIEQATGGSFVLISSTAGLKGMAGLGHYASSKHGVVGLARTLAIELGAHRIRVNTVHPTGVDTPMVNNDYRRNLAARRDPDELRGRNLLPVERIEPADVSNAVAWLCSDEARYVTGVSLPVDAGFTQW